MAQALINAGADVNRRTRDSVTPLMDAAVYGRADVAQVLVKRGADVNAPNGPEARTALSYAIQTEHADIAAILRQAGARE